MKWIIIFLLLIISIRLFHFHHGREVFHEGDEVEIEAVLLTEPQTKGRSQRLYVRTASGERVYITTAAYPKFHYGESLLIAGTIQKSERGTSYLSFPKITSIIKSSFTGGIFYFFGSIRSQVIEFFQSTLPPGPAGLLLGIVFGIREQIPSDFYNSLRSSGVLHVVAASGMNVNIVVAIFSSVAIKLIRRQFAMLIIIPAVFFYALLAGFDPPIVRASLMGLLAITAAVFGRAYFGLLALGITGWFMLMVWPYLIYDIGFQLSFAATLGIIVIRPLSKGVSLNRDTPLKKLMVLPVEDIKTTISAQISTLPILLFHFGQYGVLSLFANALVLWMVPILMVLGLVGAVGGLTFLPIGQIFLFLALPLLVFFEKAVMLVGGFHFDLKFQMPSAMVVGYYLLLGAGVLFMRNKVKSQNAKVKSTTQK